MNSEEKLLLAKAEDAALFSEKHYNVKTLGFLNPFQRCFLEKNLLLSPDISVFFDGGYPDAERTLMVCSPEEIIPKQEEYISVLECSGRGIEGLTHRDYLGSLMALGITRESVGDISIVAEKAYLFVKPETAVYLLQNLTKIGRFGVQLRQISGTEISVPEPVCIEVQTTVASLRLDSVLASAISVSRAKASEMIRCGLVAINWEIKEDVSAQIQENDLLSVRGFGRCRVATVGGITKKGRCRLILHKYC